MTPPPRALLAAALATTLVAGVVVAASTPASPLVPDHIAVVAGSPTRLVYVDYPMIGKSTPDYAHGALHVMRAGGQDRNLGYGAGNTNPADPAHYSYSIVGTSLTAYSPADPTQVAWWDLANRTHGIGALAAGATWQGSAPDGWLVVGPDHTTVATESATGKVTSFGRPVAAEPALTGAVESAAGPSGVVSVGTTSGTAAFQPWASPTTVIPLDLGTSTGSAGLRCGDASRAIAACVDRGVDGTATTELAVPLDGTAPRAFPGCGATPVAVRTQAAWICGASHPHLYFGAQRQHRSTVAISAAPPAASFGRLVTTGSWERAIVSVRNATAPLHVVLEEPSPVVRYDDANLRSAAAAVQAEALNSGALQTPAAATFPAQMLQAASDALIRAARAKDPSLRPADTRSVMGPVPKVLRRHTTPRAYHHRVRTTRSLRLFSGAVAIKGSAGLGTHSPHGGSYPAPFRKPDGVYVQPRLPRPTNPTIGMVALRAALQKLGLPYVWAAAGPTTFDCSGLVQWAYAHAGIHLIHYTGSQYQEGRLLKPKQILPGDLILFDHMVGRHHDIHHVGIYLGAGWMVNAPYTGQYVNVVRVPGGIAGIVRP